MRSDSEVALEYLRIQGVPEERLEVAIQLALPYVRSVRLYKPSIDSGDELDEFVKTGFHKLKDEDVYYALVIGPTVVYLGQDVKEGLRRWREVPSASFVKVKSLDELAFAISNPSKTQEAVADPLPGWAANLANDFKKYAADLGDMLAELNRDKTESFIEYLVRSAEETLAGMHGDELAAKMVKYIRNMQK